MTDYQKRYQSWLDSPYFDQKTKDELRRIQNDEAQIQDRFYKVHWG